MRYFFVIGAALLGVSFADKYTTPVAILKQINRHNEDGSYSYGYEAADGTFKIETKYPDGEVYGKYGYVDDTGSVREVEYGASKRGFEPTGTDITVAPPTLRKNNDYVVALRPGEEDDGQYREDPGVYYKDNAYDQPAYKQPTYREPTYRQPTYQKSTVPQSIYKSSYDEPAYREPEPPRYKPQSYQRTYEEPEYQEPVYRPRPTPKPASNFDINFDDFQSRFSQLKSQPQQRPQAQPQPRPPPPPPSYNNYNPNYSNNNQGYTNLNTFNHNPLRAPFDVDLNTGSYSLNYSG